MAISIIKLDQAQELDAFVASHVNCDLMQTSVWGKVKSDWQWRGIVCKDEAGKIRGTMAVLIRKISGLPYHMLYAPRGPICDYDDFETFDEIMEGAKELGKQFNAYRLRIDPAVDISDTSFESHAKAMGFHFTRYMEYEGFQPRFVFKTFINGRDEEEVFSAFHSKTRYNVRLAGRKGVVVEEKGAEAIADFHKIMQETGSRDGFKIRPAAYYQKVLETFGDDAKLFMAYYEGQPIAGTMACGFGKKVWFMFGGSLNSHRNVMPNYLLQWNMIQWAISRGCEVYDFRGVAGFTNEDSPHYGLYRFKKGFDAQFIEYTGEMDLVLKPGADKIVNIMQTALRKIKK